MGDLPDVQLIDITARPGGDIATAVKIADGHQRLAESAEAQSKGKAASKGKRFIVVPL